MVFLNWAIYGREKWATLSSNLARSRAFLSDFSTKSVAITTDIYYHTVMEQTVQECRYDDRIMKQLSPVGESLVWSNNGTGLLITIDNESMTSGRTKLDVCAPRL